MTYISSQSLTFSLRQSILQAQSSLSQAQTEVSTGTVADLGLTLGAQTGLSLSMKSEIDNLTSITSSNSFATTRLSSTSTAIDSFISYAQQMSQDLVGAASAGGSTTSLGSSAKLALQNLISGLNTSAGGQYIFAGINTDKAPIGDYFGTGSAGKQAVDTAFQSAFGTSQTSTAAGTISGTNMTSFLNNQFDQLFSNSNWQSTWSSASDAVQQTTIAPSQSSTTSVSGNETAFRQIAEAYTILTEFTGDNLSDGAKQAAVTKATTLINTAVGSLTNIQSGVGITQNAITSANSDMSTQMTVLKGHVSNLEDVDTYSLSTKITQLQTQLEASYQMTSQLQQLSLLNYLHG